MDLKIFTPDIPSMDMHYKFLNVYVEVYPWDGVDGCFPLIESMQYSSTKTHAWMLCKIAAHNITVITHKKYVICVDRVICCLFSLYTVNSLDQFSSILQWIYC